MVSTFRENVTSADADESRAREPRSADFIEGKREREKERKRERGYCLYSVLLVVLIVCTCGETIAVSSTFF